MPSSSVAKPVSTPTQPTPELMAFCQKLTGVICRCLPHRRPLEAPLKGFPPNQRNLISAIEKLVRGDLRVGIF
ncbi:hypothetical protein AAEJ74_07805 [Limnospira fusiformis PMC 851.14]|uniref:Uncharacterized protein n=1 Tax=Limnospira fusiformis PMC 851.14 TaxID=2219512 RepID=A0ABU9EI51_LIMFS